MQPAEHDGRRERKLAPRLGMLSGKATPGIVELVEYPAAGGGIGAAGPGEREPPRGPGDETGVELVLERLEVPAHGRERHPQPLARSRQTSGVGDGDEYLDGGELVHERLCRNPEG